MKRPEGFDPPRVTPASDEKTTRLRRGRATEQPASAVPRATPAARPVTPAASVPAPTPPTSTAPTAPVTAPADAPRSSAPTTGKTRGGRAGAARSSERDARRDLKRAARQRRRFEKGEIRRFTRRARNRRVVWLSVAGVAVTLVAVLLVAVYSPLLALKTITVDGTSRVDAAAVADAIDGQVGTPLALVDYDAITRELAEFPLIRSYVTEVVPPDALLVHIIERAPVVTVVDGAEFDLLDPAGIVVQSSETRPDGFPLVDLGGKDVDSAAFASVVEVLLSLPTPLLAQVDTISASTKDDVSFVLRGVGQSVVWGSSDDSAYKASTLNAMIATQDADSLVEYDVSAPGSVVVTPR
jgi:cell division protein FtsQ